MYRTYLKFGFNQSFIIGLKESCEPAWAGITLPISALKQSNAYRFEGWGSLCTVKNSNSCLKVGGGIYVADVYGLGDHITPGGS